MAVFTPPQSRKFMKIIINVDNDDSLHYVTIEGLKKSKVHEKIATDVVCNLLNEKMLTNITLNNWVGNTLKIRYATNMNELSTLFKSLKSDVDSSVSHDRSLLY